MESVHAYPRPPALASEARRARVVFAGVVIADSARTLRVLETTHPPVVYFPPGDVRTDCLVPAADGRETFCEWKGWAAYYDIVAGGARANHAAWFYPCPVAAYEALRVHVAFYPGRVDACYLGDELVRAQASDFYGGWITSEIQL